MTNLYFEELEIGTRSTAGPYIVSKDEIIQFAKQYDPVPRHVDEEAAARSVFGGLTATSAHTFAIFILLTTRLQPRLHVHRALPLVLMARMARVALWHAMARPIRRP